MLLTPLSGIPVLALCAFDALLRRRLDARLAVQAPRLSGAAVPEALLASLAGPVEKNLSRHPRERTKVRQRLRSGASSSPRQGGHPAGWLGSSPGHLSHLLPLSLRPGCRDGSFPPPQGRLRSLRELRRTTVSYTGATTPASQPASTLARRNPRLLARSDPSANGSTAPTRAVIDRPPTTDGLEGERDRSRSSWGAYDRDIAITGSVRASTSGSVLVSVEGPAGVGPRSPRSPAIPVNVGPLLAGGDTRRSDFAAQPMCDEPLHGDGGRGLRLSVGGHRDPRNSGPAGKAAARVVDACRQPSDVTTSSALASWRRLRLHDAGRTCPRWR